MKKTACNYLWVKCVLRKTHPMRRVIIILLLCFTHYFIFSQQVCRGVLIDSLSKAPVEFANIGITGKGVGTVTDQNGAFNFQVPDSLAGEPVKISMIGFRAKTLGVSSIQNNGRIYLSPEAATLQEVAVSASKTKIKVLGNDTRTKTVSAGFKKNNLGAELAVKLKIKYPHTQLRKFFVNINANKIDTPLFRINVYSVNEKGYPGETLLAQNIFLKPLQKTGLLELDLKPYGIYTDKPVFIAMEWIKDLGDVSGLAFSTKLVGASTYFRNASQDQWHKISGVGVGLYAEVGY